MSKPRGRPFQPGNKFGRGRPKGRQNNATLEAQQLLADNAKALTTKCILQAMQGDKAAMRLCMERLVAPRREGSLSFPRMRIKTVADVDRALEQVLKLIAAGQITAVEGESLAQILEHRRVAIEAVEFEQRLRKLEENGANNKGAENETGPETTVGNAGNSDRGERNQPAASGSTVGDRSGRHVRSHRRA